MATLGIPQNTIAVLQKYNFTFQKKYGQNFLIDSHVLEKIMDAAEIGKDDCVVEIGPGIGTLTRSLAARYKQVIALEIDRSLIPVLRYTLEDCPNVTVVNEDVMQADLSALLADAFAAGPVAVCANLPYYISTPILMMLLESRLPFDGITVMIQAEVADRLCAEAGEKAYGAITAVLNYYARAEEILFVPADRFVPAPKVNSKVIRISLRQEKPCKPQDEALLFRTIKAAFGQRRKTLANALATGFPTLGKERVAAILADMGLAADIRGERLSVADFTALSDRIGAELAANEGGNGHD